MSRAPAAPWSIGVAVLSDHPEHTFLLETLDHAGLAYCLARLDEGPEKLAGCRVWLIACHLPTGAPEAWRPAIRAHLSGGGAAVLLGNPAGLEDLTHTQPLGRDIGEGWLVAPSRSGPGGEVKLHHFGGFAARRTGDDPLIGGRLITPTGEGDDAICGVQASGTLSAIFVDVVKAVRRIQHGIPVDVDGVPAPDGAAALDDNILKAEDGMTLDWRFDRGRIPDVSFPFFMRPAADLWKELLLGEIFRVARAAGAPLKMLWYWPDGLKAVGQVSYDTDHNDSGLAHQTIRVLKELDIRTTWLVISPGYPPDSGVAEALKDNGHEIGFHFDAGIMPQDRVQGWTRERFRSQLQQVKEVCAVEGFRTNKNHYTRWQGALEILDWCVEAGITTDLTKLPSKLGTAGFFAGTCHPWFHHDLSGTPSRCLEIHGFTQDPVVTVPPAVQLHLLRVCAQHNGVAAFTWHPAHIAKDGVEDALRTSVQLGRDLGLEWWTAAEIHDWEAARRALQWSAEAASAASLPLGGRRASVLTLDLSGDLQYLGVSFRQS